MTERSTQLGRAGKYDQVAKNLCTDLKAGAVVLIVVDGRQTGAVAGPSGALFTSGIEDPS